MPPPFHRVARPMTPPFLFALLAVALMMVAAVQHRGAQAAAGAREMSVAATGSLEMAAFGALAAVLMGAVVFALRRR